MTMADSKLQYLLRLGDNALVLSQRLSEWCGKGPALEEDMALTNIALDLLGQARLWLGLAATRIEGEADEDTLAFHRDSSGFRNLLLVEQPNGSYADTLVRQFFFDVWHALVLRELTSSADDGISDIAKKAVKEVAYHLQRSSALVVRLGDGTQLSHSLMQSAVDALWPFTGEMFHADAIDAEMSSAGVGVDPASLLEEWRLYVNDILDEATLKMPPVDAWMHKGGKRGVHSEHLSRMLAEMQVLPRAHPGAVW